MENKKVDTTVVMKVDNSGKPRVEKKDGSLVGRMVVWMDYRAVDYLVCATAVWLGYLKAVM